MAADRDVRLNDTYGSLEDYAQAIEELRGALSEGKVSTELEVLEKHGQSPGGLKSGSPHSVVVFPSSTEDIVKVVNISRKYRVPITPYGGATSLEGNVLASPAGGICVNVAGMDKILEIHEEDSDLVCQPGAQWMRINDTLKEKGIPLFCPLDPAMGATIGGMISTGCSGTNAVRYGTAKGEWFLNATIVLPSGEVIKTRRRSRKCSAGFDTLKLFIGAEGTLGIVTEVTLRLAPLLPTRVAVAQFPSVEAAVKASTQILNYGINLQCVELMDASMMRNLNLFNPDKRHWPEKDSLFFKIQGATDVFIAESARIIEMVAARFGGTGFEFAATEEEAKELWLARKNAMPAALASIKGMKAHVTDVCVPVSRLPEIVAATQKDALERGLYAPAGGHVGDGNLHTMIAYNEEDADKANEVLDRLVQHALALDGTCTGEHGVGIGKKKYLVQELGASTVQFMKLIKQSVDPLNLFNPGKLYPDE